MKCQHDMLARGTTILIEGHWAAGVRARCTACNLSVAPSAANQNWIPSRTLGIQMPSHSRTARWVAQVAGRA